MDYLGRDIPKSLRTCTLPPMRAQLSLRVAIVVVAVVALLLSMLRPMT